MSQRTKIALMTGGALVALGLIISVVAISMGALSKQSVRDYNERTYSFEAQELKGVTISDINSDIMVSPSTDGSIRVVCQESPKDYYNVGIGADGRLSIKRIIKTQWFGLSFGNIDYNRNDTLVVYLPATVNGDMKVSSVNGKIEMSGLDLKGGISCGTTNGSISLTSVTALRGGDVSTTSGSIKLFRYGGGELRLKTVNGTIDDSASSVEGKLQANTTSGKIRLVNTSVAGDVTIGSVSGDVGVEAISGLNFVINTTSGNVMGSIKGSPSDYRVNVTSVSGRLNVPRSQNGPRQAKVSTTSGNVDIDIR